MRSNHIAIANDTPVAALVRQAAAEAAKAILAELHRRPLIQPEYFSLQDAAVYTGYSEQQFSDFVRRGIAPKSVLFSRSARRFKRSDLDSWCAAGGPSSLKSGEGAVAQ